MYVLMYIIQHCLFLKLLFVCNLLLILILSKLPQQELKKYNTLMIMIEVEFMNTAYCCNNYNIGLFLFY